MLKINRLKSDLKPQVKRLKGLRYCCDTAAISQSLTLRLSPLTCLNPAILAINPRRGLSQYRRFGKGLSLNSKLLNLGL